jgi:hypothetical protein
LYEDTQGPIAVRNHDVLAAIARHIGNRCIPGIGTRVRQDNRIRKRSILLLKVHEHLLAQERRDDEVVPAVRVHVADGHGPSED